MIGIVKRMAVWTAVIAVLGTAVTGCASLTQTRAGKDDFKVIAEKLKKGDKDFTIKAIQVPDLMKGGGSLETMAPALARIAEVGGNVVCMDLIGFSEDGKSLDPAVVEAIGIIATRAKDQRMGVIVRMPAGNGDAAFRKSAVQTAANALKTQGLAVYWFDGPDADELARRFKKAAPNLIVAAPQAGDLKVIHARPAQDPGRLTLLVGAMPDFETMAHVHFVLPGNDADYPALDAALTRPEEKAAWTPDNSMLSEAERNEGFVSLFNGRDLDGWWFFGDNKNGFRVNEEGNIEWVMTGGGALYSRERYDNFTLRLEWKLQEEGANSGLYIRAPREARQSKIGMEFQMMGDPGIEPTSTSTGAVYDVLPALADANNPVGEWNAVEITFNGPHLKAILNGQVVQDVNFEEHEELRYRLRRGFIGLQDHNNYVSFRNIRIKKL